MPTVECKDCKTMVSTSAEVCPCCGARYPASYTYQTPSQVTIHRQPAAFFGGAAKMVITVDGQLVRELWNDEAITVDLPFGDHLLRAHAKVLLGGRSGQETAKGHVSGALTGQVAIRILPGRVYRIEARFSHRGAEFDTYVVEDLAQSEDFGSLRRFVRDL